MKSYALNEIAEIIAGQSPSSRYYNDKGEGLPFYQGKADFGELYPSPQKWCTKPKKIAKKDDILISVRAPVGPTNLANERCCIGRGLSAIRVGNQTDTKYLLHYLRYIEPKLSGQGRGSTFSAITQKELRAVEIPLPPLAEQRRIAAVLDKAATLRRQRQQAITKLNTLLQAVFLDMFGDPVTNPKGWEVDKFGELAENQDSIRVPVKKADRASMQGQYPDYGASGIIDYVDDFLFDGKRLLIAEDGANLLSRTSPIAFIAKGKFWVNNHAHVVKFNGRARLRYLEQAFLLTDLQPYVTGSAQPKLNRKNLDSILLPCPPLFEQEKFIQVCRQRDLLRATHQSVLQNSENLFNSLQQRAFRGEL
jgi:type I restriction enzyme, S subunit